MSGFSFNFLSDSKNDNAADTDETTATGITTGGPIVNNVETTNAITEPNNNNNDRLPFTWVDDNLLKKLLAERCEEELVYNEIPLSQDESSCRQDDDTSKSVQQQYMRCVDLSRSSYRKLADDDAVVDVDEKIWENADIQTGVYEGGRKIWECSRDLVQYIVKEENNVLSIIENHEDNNKRPFYILELGCGHGLPGCCILRELGMKDNKKNNNINNKVVVVLTDYNESVILDATISNIVLNCEIATSNNNTKDPSSESTTITAEDVIPHVILGSGDWLNMSKQLQQEDQYQNSNNKKLPKDGKFDIIFAAETIYTERTAKETAILIIRHLKPNTGIAYIASKRYYFGVGGGIDIFRNYLTTIDIIQHSNEVIVDTVKVIDNGSGNIREVLKVQIITRP